MVEAGTVRRLLETIEQRLRRLERASSVELSEYVQDRDLQDIVERNLEVCIQACIDLGLHILADRPSALPETNRDVFRELVREGLVAEELGGRLEPMAGFRNILVHGYASVVPERVHETLGSLGDIREYVRQLGTHLEDQGVLPA